ncbi:PREDICTED: acidic fibroblast growth factor intracellular-binding protein-like [Priapulus caudatus]|uniref:Acidic fibroblast growth factor intracellular-binding protein-like n=1 Tax=Priapulus caudatus TaxID=37621 RepID=A0ABM1EX17_PRICU|nr:PREDICTED: acidic fibroblast growth factor intracellular-binding protein-like [Priapulus caudatus]
MKKRGVMEETGIPLEVLKSDIHNHFKLFDMLEPLLQQPPRFEKQLKFQILPEMQRMIIENYYKFDDCVIREILGKKLSSKTRKELDDVSERSRVNLKSCRRQFENMKHVFKAVEEMRGSLEQNVQQSFLLPIELARKYAAVVFITSNRFETGKKKLAYLEFDDFAHCANLMITNWSCASADCQREDMLDVDFDRDFLQDLKDLKILLDRDLIDEHKGITCRNLKARLSEKVCNDLQANFKTLSRSLVNIACNLIHSKELRDLFVDLVETFIETCRGARLCYDDVRCFLEEYQQAVKSMELIKRSNLQIYGTWDRYMNTVSSCLLQLYHI